MQEYKRQSQSLEKDIEDLQKKMAYHDDHLRGVDAWFQQVSHTSRR